MWVIEKKVVKHLLDLGSERIHIPVRVKYEYEVIDGSARVESLKMDLLYNQTLLENRYPDLDIQSLHQAIHQTAKREILTDLNQAGLLRVDAITKDEDG